MDTLHRRFWIWGKKLNCVAVLNAFFQIQKIQNLCANEIVIFMTKLCADENKLVNPRNH